MSEATEAKTLEELLPEGDGTIKLGEEVVSRDDLLQRLRHSQELEQANVLAKAELGNLRDKVNQQEGQISTLTLQQQERQKAQEEAAAAEQRAGQERDFDAEFAALDEMDEDYAAKVNALRQEQVQHEREKHQRQMDDFKEEVRGEVNSTLSIADRQRQINEANQASFDRVINDPDRVPIELTAEEKAAVLSVRNSLWGQDFAEQDQATKYLVWNDDAVVAAMYGVPSVRQKLVAHSVAEARNEGLQNGRRGREASRATPEPSRGGERGAESEILAQAKQFETMTEAQRLDFMRKNPDFATQYEEQNKDGALDLEVAGVY